MVAQNLPKLENEISLAPMSVLYNSTYEKCKYLHSRAHIYIAKGPSKGPDPFIGQKYPGLRNVQKLVKNGQFGFWSIFDGFWTVSQHRMIGIISSFLHLFRHLETQV